jgi:hypothetical protein
MRRRLRSFAGAALLVLLFVTVSCKTSEDAQATASQMTVTAKNLGDYYAALAQVIENHAKLERLQKATLGVPLNEQDLAQLQSMREVMQKRAEMAQSLADLAAALTGLSGSTAPADVSTSAANLGTELSSIQQLPGSSYAPTSLQAAGKILTQFAQERDERKMAKSIDPTMAALSEMFTQEKTAYDSINRTYIGLAQSIALDMVNHNQVDPGSLMEPALKPFGLWSRMPVEQVPQGMQDYAREQIQSQGQAEIAAHNAASTTLDGALKEMSKRVHQLAADGRMPKRGLPFTLSDVESWAKQLL